MEYLNEFEEELEEVDFEREIQEEEYYATLSMRENLDYF